LPCNIKIFLNSSLLATIMPEATTPQTGHCVYRIPNARTATASFFCKIQLEEQEIQSGKGSCSTLLFLLLQLIFIANTTYGPALCKVLRIQT
jgi:hypothetical protein